VKRKKIEGIEYYSIPGMKEAEDAGFFLDDVSIGDAEFTAFTVAHLRGELAEWNAGEGGQPEATKVLGEIFNLASDSLIIINC
jgi:hypothetical protein